MDADKTSPSKFAWMFVFPVNSYAMKMLGNDEAVAQPQD